ncbi:MAG: oxidative damage protection protein [Myxococcota bacterium]
MTRTVHCKKLNRDLPGLDFPPLRNELGRRIYDNISAEAWKMWVRHSTMIINEYQLNLTEAKAQDILREQMERFLFGDGAELPPDYVPPSHDHH